MWPSWGQVPKPKAMPFGHPPAPPAPPPPPPWPTCPPAAVVRPPAAVVGPPTQPGYPPPVKMLHLIPRAPEPPFTQPTIAKQRAAMQPTLKSSTQKPKPSSAGAAAVAQSDREAYNKYVIARVQQKRALEEGCDDGGAGHPRPLKRLAAADAFEYKLPVRYRYVIADLEDSLL